MFAPFVTSTSRLLLFQWLLCHTPGFTRVKILQRILGGSAKKNAHTTHSVLNLQSAPAKDTWSVNWCP